MSKTHNIYTLDKYAEFCTFLNYLSIKGKKFTVTPYLSSANQNSGFVVWYYK